MAHISNFVYPETHEDASYIVDGDISPVLSNGLRALYKAQPKNPLHFLGNWLLSYAESTLKADSMKEHFINRDKLF